MKHHLHNDPSLSMAHLPCQKSKTLQPAAEIKFIIVNLLLLNRKATRTFTDREN